MVSDNFDLVTEEWIDVSWIDPRPGQPPRVGLGDLFTHSGEIASFHAPFAPAAAGLMRVLVVLAGRMTGLDRIGTKPEWQRRRRDLLVDARGRFDPAAIERVLSAEDGFELFGPRPFLQDPRLAEECKSRSGVGKFAWTRVAGANQVFLSHDRDDAPVPVWAGEAVWHLLAWLYYGPSGRCTARAVDSTDKADTGAGPLRRTLSVHPWGASLFETLLLNQVYLPPDPTRPELALWESGLNDPVEVPPEGAGPGWRLANRFRHAVLLVPDEAGENVTDAYMTWAWRQAHPPADDPYVPYQVNAKTEQRYPRYADADRAIWRDLDSLILKVPAGTSETHPQVVMDLKGRPGVPAEILQRLRLRVFGYDQDGQTRDKAFFEATTPPVLNVLDNPALDDRIERLHHAGSDVGNQLQRTLGAAWIALAGKPKKAAPWVGPAMADYWTRAGDQFWHLALAPGALPVLPNAFIRIATAVYDEATAAYATNPPAIDIIETHRGRLFRGWQKEPADDHRDDHTDTPAVATSRGAGASVDAGSTDEDW